MSDKVIVMGRNPGRVCHEIQIPSTIRHTAPFRAREQSGFMDLFHMIWKLMEDVDCEEGEEDETATDFA